MELRDYQKHSLKALWDWFKANPQGAPLLVLPTGSGKSHIIAEVARSVAKKGLDRRVLVLAHRKELLEQNYQKLLALWPWGAVGLYSAGLGRKDTACQVLFAGVQSAFKKAADLGRFSLVVVDEAHLIPASGEGMYRTLIDGLRRANPDVRFCGLTATPYRLGSGLLTQGADALFTAVAYDAGIRELIDQGYLSPLVSKSCKAQPDMTGVAVRAGEYVTEQAERAFNRLDLVEAALSEVVTLGAGRKSWLLFASGVSHAERITEVLNRVGIKAGVVTGTTPPLFRDQVLTDFKAGRLTALVNCDVLTTGFDHPGIDLIAVLRATKSTGLWVQICGRGCRKADGKEDCLILDFGGNAFRFGPLDRLRITYRTNPLTGKQEGKVDSPPVKLCPACRSVCPLPARECPDCGAPFPDAGRLSHEPEASSAPILSKGPAFQDVDVLATHYKKHVKQDTGSESVRVDYVLSQLDDVPVKTVSEWKSPAGNVMFYFRPWWAEMGGDPDEPVPSTVDAALARIHDGELRTPQRVRIKPDGKFWRVVKVLEFHPEGEEPVDPQEEFFRATGVNL